jgi:hypothetical protein
MKYHCKDRENRTLSIHGTVSEALRAREVWLHTRELVGIADSTGRLLTAEELYQAKAAVWLKGLR